MLQELTAPLQDILNQMPGLPDAASLLQATAVLQALNSDMIALLTDPNFQKTLERLQNVFKILEDPRQNKVSTILVELPASLSVYIFPCLHDS